VQGAVGYDSHLFVKGLISRKFNPKIVLALENRIAVPLGGEVAPTSNEHSIYVEESLGRIDLENQVRRIGPYHLSLHGASDDQLINSAVWCMTSSSYCSVVPREMNGRSINRGI